LSSCRSTQEMNQSRNAETTRGQKTVAYVVRNSKIHGNGVFAKRKIPAGTRVIEYKGERITWKQASKRDAHDPENPFHTFFFSLEDGRVIDGGDRGNESRWINHACEPNCEAREEDGRVFIYALRDIRRGEELNYDYGLVVDDRHTPSLKRSYACLCNAATCRHTMLAPKKRGSRQNPK
jgi:SET domain-containing protein